MKVSQDLLKTNVYHHSAARSPAENSSLPSSPGIPSSDRVQGDAQRSVTSSLEAGTASIVIPPSVGSPTSSSSPAA